MKDGRQCKFSIQQSLSNKNLFCSQIAILYIKCPIKNMFVQKQPKWEDEYLIELFSQHMCTVMFVVQICNCHF